MSTNYDYCLDKATLPGSNFYYAILFEKGDVKTSVIPLYALHNEFIDCLTASPDPGVTRLKFNWWHEELSRLSENSPRHPVTRTIQSTSDKYPDIISTLHKHLMTIESIVMNAQSENHRGWLENNSNEIGQYWSMLNMFRENTDNNLLIQNGALVFGLELLMLYPLFAEKVHRFICAELISKHSSADGEVQYHDVFEEIICDYHKKLNQTYISLCQTTPKTALFNLILNRLATTTCEEIKRDGFRLMKHRIQLTPIRKFWISCCTRLGI
jgi:phytoene synthase